MDNIFDMYETESQVISKLKEEEAIKKESIPYQFDQDKIYSGDFPDVKEYYVGKGKLSYKILDTLNNINHVLNHYKVSIKYNKMSRQREITHGKLTKQLEGTKGTEFSLVRHLCVINDVPTNTLNEHLTEIAFINSYHPIRESLDKNPWDKTSRLNDFIWTLTPANNFNENLFVTLVKTWMISGIAAAYSENGFISHGVLVLSGPQGIGKTSWFRKLNFIDQDAIKESAYLDVGSKDKIIQLSRYWIIELGELDGIYSQSKMARLKSYITTQIDEERGAYDRFSERLPRRSIFGATVNHDDFLIDKTGNRRWWVIPVVEIDYDHNLDMQQVWAEAKYYYDQGASTHLSKEDQIILNESNRLFENKNSMEELIISKFYWETPCTEQITALEVLNLINWPLTHERAAGDAARIIKKLNGGLTLPRKNNCRLIPVPRIKY